MRRIFRKQPVIKVAARTSIAAPPTTPAHSKRHWRNHTYQRQKANYGIKEADDKIYQQDPVERQPFYFKMTMELFFCYRINNRKELRCKNKILKIDYLTIITIFA